MPEIQHICYCCSQPFKPRHFAEMVCAGCHEYFLRQAIAMEFAPPQPGVNGLAEIINRSVAGEYKRSKEPIMPQQVIVSEVVS